jgi:oligo-1,6-glucosidase
MAYPFAGVDIATVHGYSLAHFKEVFSQWDSAFADEGWLSIFLSNHDQARLVSRFGNDAPAFRDASSKMLSTFILTMRGTPYYYNGDELGMTNPGFTTIDDYRDKAALNEYQHTKDIGRDTQRLMKEMQFGCRDNGRTPFQWSSETNAGFTTGTPWIKINSNYPTINVAEEEKEDTSCLNYFRRLTKLRKDNLVLVYGKYTLLDRDNTRVYAYTREMDGAKMLVVLNFSSIQATTQTGINDNNAQLLLCNYSSPAAASSISSITLRPYEARVYKLSVN